MNPLSVWAINTESEFDQRKPLFTMVRNEVNWKFYQTSDSLWLSHFWEDGNNILFRLVHSSSGALEQINFVEQEHDCQIALECSSFTYQVHVHFFNDQPYAVRYIVSATSKRDVIIPFWPKDILSFRKDKHLKKKGTIHTHQVGTRSGILYFDDGDSGSVFYFQNLSALNDYAQITETSLGSTVGGTWPEIGFSLPVSEKPLKKGDQYTISDAIVVFDQAVRQNEAELAVSYLNHLAWVYLQLPRPQRFYHNWLDTVDQGLNDLTYHKGCWTFADGNSYLNAYVADYKTPPEVMVQLAVLLPMIEYMEWRGTKSHQVVQYLMAGIGKFYQSDIGTIVRWLPAAEKQLDYSEEQKQPRVMDSWYLHHPLMNLARLGRKGNEEAARLFFDSIAYVMRVAQHFKYQWPVFYQMDTLQVLKAETEPGAGGEKDVPGTYTDLMLRAWEVTQEEIYLKEAKLGAEALKGHSFDVFYQANDTAISAVAMLKLFKITKEQHYLELSYVCLAAIFNNVQLWECDYGHAKHYPTFFAVFPLKDAPYTAAYEEQEVYALLFEYLKEAADIEILPSVRLLIAEFIRHTVGRVAFYYPPLLHQDVLATEAKTGELDPKLWIAVEDLRDGWEQSGQVGQEVYGAGIAFGVIPRQYLNITGLPFFIFCDYPIKSFHKKGQKIWIQIDGDQRLHCRLLLLKNDEKPYVAALSFTNDQEQSDLKPIKKNKELTEYNLPGGCEVTLNWHFT